MKLPASLVFACCSLSVSADTLAGQLAEGPLRASIAREAVRAARAASAGARQTATPHDWNAVRLLKAGSRVRIVTRQDRRFDGPIKMVSDDAIVIGGRWGREVTLQRDDVRELRRRPAVKTSTYTGVGILAGTAIGILGGKTACNHTPCAAEELFTPTPALLIGGLLGGAGGFAVGKGVDTRSGQLIYTRPPEPRGGQPGFNVRKS